jgi:outer membrane protein OmpA-like peptidoglycan-associated protein
LFEFSREVRDMKRILLTALAGFIFAGMASLANATTLEDAQTLISDAQQLRAAEFSPGHYAKARSALDKAKALSASQGDPAEVATDLDTAAAEAKKASETAQLVTTRFSNLVEARDRMELAGTQNMRQDLLQRAEDDFSHVVAAVEDGDMKKADRDAKIAMNTVHAAQVVAARNQFAKPIAKAIAGARRVDARKFSPKALDNAIQSEKQLDALIHNDPNAQTQAYAISQHGQEEAVRSMRISELGKKFESKPADLETWMDTEDARMRMLGDALGIQLSRSQTPEQQVALLKQAVQDMKNNYEGRIADADAQLKDLSQKLAQSQGELTDLAQVRRKLELKREAEAKIKRLTKLFDPTKVEILLTPDADVILRLNGLNFRSGSAAIPPNSYPILDNVLKSIDLFPDRAVRVEGHTDSIGANDYNKALSARRAEAVEQYLIGRMENANTHKFTAIGYGKDKPIAVNDTPEGRAKNRRIDIVLIAPPAAPSADSAAAPAADAATAGAQ